MTKRKKIAVISTGNGGQSMAAYLSFLGYDIALYAREKERVDMYKSNVFDIHGVVEGTAHINMISHNMEEVIEDAYLIMVTTPAQYVSKAVAPVMAKHLKDDQIVVLNPGRTLGSHVFYNALRNYGCTTNFTLAETDTFVFTCRCMELGRPHIYAIKSNVKVAAYNRQNTDRVVSVLQEFFPEMVPAKSVLHTGFSNIGMVFHPMPILMNITRVEAKENFLYYKEGISPLVASVLERLDAERVSVAARLGVEVPSAFEWLKQCYGSEGDSLYERIQNTAAYSSVYAPIDIDTRYVFEDLQTGCVPVSCLGKAIGIPTPVIDSIIDWSSTIYDYDFYQEGFNASRFDFIELLKHTL